MIKTKVTVLENCLLTAISAGGFWILWSYGGWKIPTGVLIILAIERVRSC